MRERKKSLHLTGERSLRTFVFYCAVVLFIIGIALSFKFFTVLQQSKFDGIHRYTVAVIHNDKSADVISIDPSAQSASRVHITSEKKLPNLGKYLGIPIDGTVRDAKDSYGGSLAPAFYSYALRFHRRENGATIFDFLRLGMAAQGIDSTKISEESIPDTMTSNEVDAKLTDFFVDHTIANEKVSIEIVNASGVTGRGSNLERLLTNLGCTIVQVSTAPSPQTYSSLAVVNKNTYTDKRIAALLNFSVKDLSKDKLSDIIIVLGTDSATHPAF